MACARCVSHTYVHCVPNRISMRVTCFIEFVRWRANRGRIRRETRSKKNAATRKDETRHRHTHTHRKYGFEFVPQARVEFFIDHAHRKIFAGRTCCCCCESRTHRLDEMRMANGRKLNGTGIMCLSFHKIQLTTIWFNACDIELRCRTEAWEPCEILLDRISVINGK